MCKFRNFLNLILTINFPKNTKPANGRITGFGSFKQSENIPVIFWKDQGKPLPPVLECFIILTNGKNGHRDKADLKNM